MRTTMTTPDVPCACDCHDSACAACGHEWLEPSASAEGLREALDHTVSALRHIRDGHALPLGDADNALNLGRQALRDHPPAVAPDTLDAALDVERFQQAWSGHMLSSHAGAGGLWCGTHCADDIADQYAALRQQAGGS